MQSESEFEQRAEATLRRLVEALADLEDERMEAELESGVLSIRFEDGTKYVINSHRAARQIWAAADASAWHFDLKGKDWRSTRSDEELWALVRERVSRKLGRPIELNP